MREKLLPPLLAFACLLLSCPLQSAEDAKLLAVVGIGPAISIPENPYKKTHTSYLPVPVLRIENGNADGTGSILSWRLMKSPVTVLGLTGYIDHRFFDPKDAFDPQMKLVKKRPRLIMAGMKLTTNLPQGKIRLNAVGDVTGETNGIALQGLYLYPILLNDDKVSISPSVGVEWDSTSILKHFYGVSQQESVKSGFSQFKPNHTLIPIAEVEVTYQVYDNFHLLVNVGGSYLPDAVSKSPILETNWTYSVLLGVIYKFGIASGSKGTLPKLTRY